MKQWPGAYLGVYRISNEPVTPMLLVCLEGDSSREWQLNTPIRRAKKNGLRTLRRCPRTQAVALVAIVVTRSDRDICEVREARAVNVFPSASRVYGRDTDRPRCTRKDIDSSRLSDLAYVSVGACNEEYSMIETRCPWTYTLNSSSWGSQGHHRHPSRPR
jgi:hypothetical protein